MRCKYLLHNDMIQIDHIHIHHIKTWVPSQYKDSGLTSIVIPIIKKMVSWLSYLYNGNPHTYSERQSLYLVRALPVLSTLYKLICYEETWLIIVFLYLFGCQNVQVLESYFGCYMAFIEPMHCNKPNFTYLLESCLQDEPEALCLT